ncbi:MAG: SDR family oxidoreductase [Alphaproteobacteria bacterium]|nr:SDR family oxidoreductase [Alphaproteobacteria bacterium]
MTAITIITGASGGIGEALAYQFAGLGEDLLLVARSGDKLQRVADEIVKRHSCKVDVLELDLSLLDAVGTLVSYLKENDLSVKHMVNNAGFGLNGPMRELGIEAQLNIVDLNVRVLTDLSIRFLDEIEANGGGVMNVASTVAFLATPYMGVYGASKAFVLSFTEALAEESKHRNIKVSAVCPGSTETGFGERAQMGRSDLFDYAPLMSAEAVAEIGFNGYMRGETIVVTGTMNRLLPYMLRLTPKWLSRLVIGRLMNTEK